jgi:Fe2+ transport system protein FeoA
MHLRSAIFQSSICSLYPWAPILNYDKYGRTSNNRPFQRIPGDCRLTALSELKVGESGILGNLDLPESVQNLLMHMGLVPDALVTVVRRAPAGDPIVYGVDGMEIALRRETASAIHMRDPEAETQPDAAQEIDSKRIEAAQ